MPSRYLIEHALDNVWCSPDQDFQVIIKPHRLTDYLGVKAVAKVEWQQIGMPDPTTKFHLYQIGNLHPGLVGLFPRAGHWARASDHMNVQGMTIDIYGKMGVHLPRFETWFVVLPNRNMLVAIADQGDLFKLAEQEIFVRFYSNAYFESDRSDAHPSIPTGVYMENPLNDWANLGGIRASGVGGDVLTEGIRVKRRADLMALQNRVTELRAMNIGRVLCYYNGQLVPDFLGSYYTTARIKEGDWAEFVMDASIREVLEFKIADLETFDSILDGLRKYLIHRPTEVIDHIQFKDDIDFYLTRPVANGTRFEGRHFYQNTKKAVRMVTHQDWAIPVPFVLGYTDIASGFANPMGWTLRVYVREAGFLRPLMNEHSRIRELYKLPPAERSRALLGINSTLEFWRADHLENSLYPDLMRRPRGNIQLGEVEAAYGYNAISKVIADSPLATYEENGARLVKLPPGLQRDATIFEYNAQGRLLGWHQTYGTTNYTCRNAQCDFIEGRVGLGGPTLSTHFGTTPYTVDPDVDYFFMKVQIWNGVITGQWEQAIEEVDYVYRDGKVHWNIDPVNWLCVIRNNKHFLTYTTDLDATDGLMIMSVQSEEDSAYEPANRVESVPYGKLDVWLNGRGLIENIDYVVRWPQLVICNKEYISVEPLQRVTIRCTGLPMVDENGMFYRQLPLDVGFVKYGQLSRNNRYDVRDDKVQRVIVRGSVKKPSLISYPENGPGVSVGDIANGDPYAVEEVIVPVARFTERGTYELRDTALVRDRRIEDYVSQFIQDPVEENANPITERYELFSPFLAKVIRDLQRGYLVVGNADVPFSTSKVREWLADYLYLLEYDPIKLELDDDYVSIHPHDSYQVQTLGVYEYHLVEKAVQLYLKNKVDISRFVAIDTNWVPIPSASR